MVSSLKESLSAFITKRFPVDKHYVAPKIPSVEDIYSKVAIYAASGIHYDVDGKYEGVGMR